MYLQHLANSSIGPTLGDPVQEVRTPPHIALLILTKTPLIQIVRLQSAHLPGYNRALASSIRFGPIRGQSSSYTNLAKSGRSVLLIHVCPPPPSPPLPSPKHTHTLTFPIPIPTTRAQKTAQSPTNTHPQSKHTSPPQNS
jgi:hypothetical protein